MDAFVAALRTTVEDVEEEVRRRIKELPDGTVHFNQFMDSTLKENILIKFSCKVTVKGDKMTVDLRGTGPEILNRAINSPLCSVKSMFMQAILAFWWPDLPRCTSAMSPIEIISDEHTWADAGYDAPMGQSLQASFRGFSALQSSWAKMQFANPEKFSNVIAPWFNQINTFLWGGLTQHGDQVGNLCADLNGMPGGAKAFVDGEDAVSPLFCAMADTAEQEVMEEEVPFMQLVSKRLVRTGEAAGKQADPQDRVVLRQREQGVRPSVPDRCARGRAHPAGHPGRTAPGCRRGHTGVLHSDRDGHPGRDGGSAMAIRRRRLGRRRVTAETDLRVRRQDLLARTGAARRLRPCAGMEGRPTRQLAVPQSGSNFNPVCAMAGKVAIAEVEHLVEPGDLDPDAIHLPGVYIDRVLPLTPEQAVDQGIERLTTRPRPSADPRE
jgi:hypothetical protein